MTKYKGKEDQLFSALVKKYGPEPTPEELSGNGGDDDDDEDETDEEDERVASAKPEAGAGGDEARAGAGDDDDDDDDDEGEDEEEAEGGELVYCGVCGMPPEYCEFGERYEKCVPWIKEHCPRLLEGVDGAEKKAKGVLRKKVVTEDKQRVVITKEMRMKRKAVTVVLGLETFNVKLKDAAKAFGKKFACSSSVKETATGGQEIVIQGDVVYDLPDFIKGEFKVPGSKITVKEGKGK